MATIPDLNGLDHSSTTPPKTLDKNSENPLDVEEEPNLEANIGNEIKTVEEADNRIPKPRGRAKKKEKHKQPTSETGSKQKPEEDEYDRPVYSSPFQDETRSVFLPSDLVWGKVKSHPWWPGQIFDPSAASELALKHRNKNNLLVAYFGDNTFAWIGASVLKPFQSNFSHIVKQCRTDYFMSAVDAALVEVSWRMEYALSCGCYTSGASSAQVKINNVGIRADVFSPSGDVSFIRRSFDSVKFLGFLCELGNNPDGGSNSLDLVVAKSQLKAFNLSRGCNFDLPEFGISSVFQEEPVSPVTYDKIYPRKHKSIDRESGEEPFMRKCVPEEGRKKIRLSEIYNKKKMLRTPPKAPKVHVGGPTGFDNSGKNKKRMLDSLGDLGTKSRARRKYLRVGQCMRKTTIEVTYTKTTTKPNGMTSRKRKCLSMIKDTVKKKILQRKKREVSSDNLSSGKSGRKKKDVLREGEDDEGFLSLDDYSSLSGMVSQLCLAARDPLKGYGFITMIVSFFTRYRGCVANPKTGKGNWGESVSGKSNSLEEEVQNCYLSDLVVGDSDEEKLTLSQLKKQKNRKGKKEKILEGPAAIFDFNTDKDLGNENKQEGNSVNSGANGHEPMPEVEESMPTALVLNFKETAPLPTKAELNGLFTHFGPVKEAETEVSEQENGAQVIFKRHTDAAVAFIHAGKLDAFGPDLVSFQLSCPPTSSHVKLNTSQVELQKEKDATSPVKAAC